MFGFKMNPGEFLFKVHRLNGGVAFWIGFATIVYRDPTIATFGIILQIYAFVSNLVKSTD